VPPLYRVPVQVACSSVTLGDTESGRPKLSSGNGPFHGDGVQRVLLIAGSADAGPPSARELGRMRAQCCSAAHSRATPSDVLHPNTHQERPIDPWPIM
jgi:hypothetical protein